MTIDQRIPLNGPIHLVQHDPEWGSQYARLEARIRGVLGETACLIEHVGSTSVPGLAAKPVIDIILVVPDSADESSYLPALQGAGFVLRIREPDWFQHRLFKARDAKCNLHVFSDGCEEVDRMLTFRDWLKRNDADRQLYEKTKRQLATRTWRHTQDYADAKSEVVRAILSRAATGNETLAPRNKASAAAVKPD
jgi:GrpB-like predicted nucleotidyltransferase (UPF0157 family)